MDISIIILNYKSKGFTMNCIKSIRDADFQNLKCEIIVADNNSHDHIGEILNWQYPEIKFIQNEANLGMGAGNNAGIRIAQGDYIVVMNPDTQAFFNTFIVLYNYMQANPKAGVVGPLQYNPDKTIQNSCYRWHRLLTPLYRRTFLGKFRFAQLDVNRYLMKDFNHDVIREVDWLLGSFLFIRAKALEQVGIFDERYFMYLEDTDLCRRFHEKGWQVVYNPEAKIVHNHSRQSAQDPWYRFFLSRAARAHISSWIKYLQKWGFGKLEFRSKN